MAAGRGVMIGGRECIIQLSSSILGIGLLLIFARWLPSPVVERDYLYYVFLATGLISRPVVLCRGKFLITAKLPDSDH